MREDLAQRTLQHVDEALKSGRVASMPELVRIIQALSSDEGSVSISELAEMINHDTTVLMRVIAAANTFGYNPNGNEITTVTEAIHTIGFNRVRRLAMSLMLLDHAERNCTPFEQRHMAAVSLCSGVIAQIAAEHSPLIEPDLAFVCASLRNFGRLLLGTFMTDEFRQASAEAAAGRGDQAFRDAFGLSPFDLGYELLKSNNLPPVILNAVRHHPLPDGDKLAWSEQAIRTLSAFALDFSELALDSTISHADFAERQEALVRGISRDFPLLAESLPEVMSDATRRLTALNRAAGMDTFGESGLDRLRSRTRVLVERANPAPPAPPPSSETTAPAEELDPPTGSTAPPDPPGDTEASHDSAPAEPTATLPFPSPPLDFEPAPAPTSRATPPPPRTPIEEVLSRISDHDSAAQALPLMLNAVWLSLKPCDILYCALDRDGRTFRIQVGRGPLNTFFGRRAVMTRDERNAFLLCHERLINLCVQDTHDDRIRRHLPDWLKTPDAPRSFLALPVHHNRTLQGLLMIGWADPRASAFTNEELAPVQSLIDRVAHLQSQRRRRAA